MVGMGVNGSQYFWQQERISFISTSCTSMSFEVTGTSFQSDENQLASSEGAVFAVAGMRVNGSQWERSDREQAEQAGSGSGAGAANGKLEQLQTFGFQVPWITTKPNLGSSA